MTNTTRPQRIEDVSVQIIEQETLIYDRRRHKAFCLNRASAAVWNLCDGEHTAEQIASTAKFECDASSSAELVRFALDQLYGDGLLQTVPAAAPLLSRRQMMEKLGARALVMMPVVAAVLVPEAAQAVSGIVDGDQSRSRARRQSLSNEPAPSKSDPESLW